MKIMVVFTGGTIGSTVNGDFISPDNSQGSKLISQYEILSKQNDSEHTLTLHTCMPYSLLSENLNGNHLNKLVECIKSTINSKENYDGIIITHGTDTLQYTAAALDYIFAGISIPIVLVSSNYILDDSRANGLHNFYFAVEFIKKNISGVFVSYRNIPGQLDIHYGSRLLAHTTCQDEIHSIGNCYLGRFQYDFLTENNSYAFLENDVIKRSPTTNFKLPANCLFSTTCPVLYIKAMPGFRYPTIPKETAAVLIDSYHSGTICTESNDLIIFCKEASSKNIPIFLVGAEDRTAYESTKIYDNLEINVLPKASPIAMYVKLWLLSQLPFEKEELIEATYTPISKEFI